MRLLLPGPHVRTSGRKTFGSIAVLKVTLAFERADLSTLLQNTRLGNDDETCRACHELRDSAVAFACFAYPEKGHASDIAPLVVGRLFVTSSSVLKLSTIYLHTITSSPIFQFCEQHHSLLFHTRTDHHAHLNICYGTLRPCSLHVDICRSVEASVHVHSLCAIGRNTQYHTSAIHTD